VTSRSDAGTIYEFEPLADKPLRIHKVPTTKTSGDFRVCDPEGDGTHMLLVGSSALADQYMVKIDPSDGSVANHPLIGIGPNGYRVTRVETIPNGDSWQFFMICGTHIVLIDPDLDPASQQKFACKYAFNDMWKDAVNNRILLASSQSGGSCIHIIDLNDPEWAQAFMDLDPPGKIQTIRTNAADTRTKLANFTAPAWERDPLPVYLTTSCAPWSIAWPTARPTCRTPTSMPTTWVWHGNWWPRARCFVPTRDEIVSFSPVHVSIAHPAAGWRVC
jgi:hypothetical protein